MRHTRKFREKGGNQFLLDPHFETNPHTLCEAHQTKERDDNT